MSLTYVFFPDLIFAMNMINARLVKWIGIVSGTTLYYKKKISKSPEGRNYKA